MNIIHLILVIFFKLFILGISGANAQSVSPTLKLDLKPFLSIGIQSEKIEQDGTALKKTHTQLEITSLGPFQVEVRDSTSQKLKSIIDLDILDKSITMIIAPEYSFFTAKKIFSNETISKLGGTFSIDLFDNRGSKQPLIVSITSL